MTVRRDRSIAGVYVMLFPVALVLSIVGTYVVAFGLNALAVGLQALAFDRDALPARPPMGPTAAILLSIAFNTVPGGLAGVALYYPVARRLQCEAPASSRHWHRALPLYLLAILLLSVIAVAVRANPSNGMVAQLFLWPAMAALGGAVGDSVAWPSRRRAPAV